MPHATLDTHLCRSVSVTGLLPCFVQLSRSLHLPNSNQLLGPNPKDISISGLASCNFARHYFRNRLFTFFSSGYLDVSVPRVPFIPLCIRKYDTTGLTMVCSHIRISTDQCSFATPRSFSQLITSFIGA